jgi:hypothetical protein
MVKDQTHRSRIEPLVAADTQPPLGSPSFVSMNASKANGSAGPLSIPCLMPTAAVAGEPGFAKKPAFGGLRGRPGMFAEGCLVARVTTEDRG